MRARTIIPLFIFTTAAATWLLFYLFTGNSLVEIEPVWTGSRPLLSALIVIGAYIVARTATRTAISRRKLGPPGKPQIIGYYLACVLAVLMISVTVGAIAGTHRENEDLGPLDGRGTIVADEAVSDARRGRLAIAAYLTLIVPGLCGIRTAILDSKEISAR